MLEYDGLMLGGEGVETRVIDVLDQLRPRAILLWKARPQPSQSDLVGRVRSLETAPLLCETCESFLTTCCPACFSPVYVDLPFFHLYTHAR